MSEIQLRVVSLKEEKTKNNQKYHVGNTNESTHPNLGKQA